MAEPNWYGKPYYSLDAYCREQFGRKCYKVALNAHMTCPNRDGSLGTRGCIFCSAGGSGEFAVEVGDGGGGFQIDVESGVSSRLSMNPENFLPSQNALADLDGQLRKGIQLIEGKLGIRPDTDKPGNQPDTDKPGSPLNAENLMGHYDKNSEKSETPGIIAYFQAYTNTYAPAAYLEQIFSQALSHPLVCGISIATRPDCLPHEVLSLLATLRQRYLNKFIWVELGLQTIHGRTADFIRRGYDLICFERSVGALQALNIPVIVHVILGLPGEGRAQMLETISYLNRLGIFGVKLQLLHVLEGTDLAELYSKGALTVLDKEEYLDILVDCLEHLSPKIVVHRVTGDGPKRILIAPTWSGNKRDVLNSLHRLMRERDARQGRLCDL